jgi:alpha-tubulin suppressor-like RCC1 family protein
VGDGTTTSRLRPAAVAGGLSFKLVEAGSGHTCGITTAGRAYCWGSNGDGQLGSGSTADRSLTPAAVAHDQRFISITAGFNHTCGVNASHRALCWGGSAIGDGKTHRRWTPRLAATRISFDRISAGTFSTCAETTNRVYCWGANTYGGLGDGSTTQRLTPVAVSGGHFFAQASAGGFFACGMTSERKAYCWGRNFGGELGDGTREDRWTPTRVLDPI